MQLRRLFCALHFTASLLALSNIAFAEEGEGLPRVPLLPKYQQECSGCHVVYPPRLLPAASWQRLLGNLSHHYGTDASLDPASTKQIQAWLLSQSATRNVAAPPEDRITRSAWFARQHDEVPGSAWKLPAVKTAANCAACHTRADQGDFNERYVRIPR